MFAAVGEREQIEFIDMPEVLRGKYQYFTQARLTKLQKAGCLRNPRPLEEGVKQYVEWLKAERQSD
jgi:ADP-L-glycero-D-manno-heptose 6-epimerase